MRIIVDGNIPFAKECFSSIGQVEVVTGRQITRSVVADVEVVIVRSITAVNAELLAGAKVRFVGTATIGFDHVDVGWLRENKIGFGSAPGSNANSAAEYVIAALLEIAQKYDIDLEGKSIGIVGVGNVGSRVAMKAAALGMQVYRNDPPLQRQTGDPKYLPIEDLFDCDFITLHTPLTYEGPDKTFHLADEGFFNSLKERCVFINASRGAVVDSVALKKAIRLGRLRAVVLDVWENEPNIDLELLRLVDVGTPHIAGYSLDGKIVGMIVVYKAVCEHFGVEAKYDVADFLPDPAIRDLRVVVSGGRELDAVAGVVQKIYDIRRDDTRLRWIWGRAASKVGEYFDGLRKDYAVRREFHNTRVTVVPGSADVSRLGLPGRGGDTAAARAVAGKLAGIGFEVIRQQ